MRKIKHNDLTHYFMTPHEHLPASYLASCEKFFDSICWPRYYGGGPSLNYKIYKLQAPSSKLQAASKKELDSYEIPDIK